MDLDTDPAVVASRNVIFEGVAKDCEKSAARSTTIFDQLAELHHLLEVVDTTILALQQTEVTVLPNEPHQPHVDADEPTPAKASERDGCDEGKVSADSSSSDANYASVHGAQSPSDPVNTITMIAGLRGATLHTGRNH